MMTIMSVFGNQKSRPCFMLGGHFKKKYSPALSSHWSARNRKTDEEKTRGEDTGTNFQSVTPSLLCDSQFECLCVFQWLNKTPSLRRPSVYLQSSLFSSTVTTKNFLPPCHFPIITAVVQSQVLHYPVTLKHGFIGTITISVMKDHSTFVFLWCRLLNKTKLSHEWCSQTDDESGT